MSHAAECESCYFPARRRPCRLAAAHKPFIVVLMSAWRMSSCSTPSGVPTASNMTGLQTSNHPARRTESTFPVFHPSSIAASMCIARFDSGVFTHRLPDAQWRVQHSACRSDIDISSCMESCTVGAFLSHDEGQNKTITHRFSDYARR